MANWSTGNVQKIQSFNEHTGRILSTKLKDRYLVTLGEVSLPFFNAQPSLLNTRTPTN